MTESIVWKYATEHELAELAEHYSVEDCKRSLAKMFGLDPKDEKQSLLIDCHLHNYSFCRQNHFQLDQTSAFLGMCEKLMKCDFAIDSSTTLTESFEKFQSTLLTHSVNRSPNSVGIFCREEVDKIVDYVTDSYYRHFELYKCIFTPYNHFHLIQREINDIEIPNIPHPLSQGSLQSVEL